MSDRQGETEEIKFRFWRRKSSHRPGARRASPQPIALDPYGNRQTPHGVLGYPERHMVQGENPALLEEGFHLEPRVSLIYFFGRGVGKIEFDPMVSNPGEEGMVA
jgi:hypothetical protein